MMRARSTAVAAMALALGLPGPLPIRGFDLPPVGSERRVEAVPSGTEEVPGRPAYGDLPLLFVANAGQEDPRVRFVERGPGHAVFFTPEGIYLGLRAGSAGADGIALVPLERGPEADLRGEEPAPAKVNYFLGNDPARWVTGIPTFAAVAYRGIQTGVDLRFHGNGGRLEYDLVLQPGADLSRVGFACPGVRGLRITEGGGLEMTLRQGRIVQRQPIAWQEERGRRLPVDARFRLLRAPAAEPQPGARPGNLSAAAGGHQPDRLLAYGFELGAHDPRLPLVIDPTLVYSTYLGGGDLDKGIAIGVDAAGFAYVTGWTKSIDFPTVDPLQPDAGGEGDAFVTKLDPSGTAMIYSTYLGGTELEKGLGILVDAAGDAFVVGYTFSTDFPTARPLQPVNGGARDAFVAKLDPSGSVLLFSTYLGGDGDDVAQGIGLDAEGNAYAAGFTSSSNFPTVNPFQPEFAGTMDVFVSKVSADGSALAYSTYLGGTLFDAGLGIAVDRAGRAMVTGFTGSTDLPTASALQPAPGGGGDAFVSKLSADGSRLVYSTYLGGSASDGGHAVAADAVGNAYLTGFTASTDFPVAHPLQPAPGGGGDAWVAKLPADGSALAYSTYLGGSAGDAGQKRGGIAVDTAGNAYVTGETFSTNFPVTPGTLDASANGGEEAFVVKIDPVGARLVYSTYLGGSEDDIGSGIAVGPAGEAFVTGWTASGDFPMTAGAVQTTYGGGQFDGFVSRIVHQRFEEDDAAIAYTGSWTRQSCSLCSGGAVAFSQATGASAELSFLGTGIKWVVNTGPILGKASVRIDDGPTGSVDLYRPEPASEVLFFSGGSTPGNHTLTISVSGEKNPSSSGFFVELDALEVVP